MQNIVELQKLALALAQQVDLMSKEIQLLRQNQEVLANGASQSVELITKLNDSIVLLIAFMQVKVATEPREFVSFVMRIAEEKNVANDVLASAERLAAEFAPLLEKEESQNHGASSPNANSPSWLRGIIQGGRPRDPEE